MKVVVIGAGMTGLACAWALRSSCDVVVLEASERVGGNVRTHREGGFIMDAGPDAWLASKPEASALACEAKLDDVIGTRPENRRVYVAYRGRLHPMPEGVVLGVPTRITPMLATRLFSLRGKARMGLEPLVPRRARADADEDESVSHFVARRLGREAAERLAGPLLGGIFAGDAHRISVQAAFPQLIEQEKRYGSLVLAMRAARKASENGTKDGVGHASAFLSLRSGMAAFPEKLAVSLDVRLGARVTAVSRVPHGQQSRPQSRFEVITDGEHLACDAVVIAAGPSLAASILGPLDADAAELVSGIRCGSSAAVFLGYKREHVTHPLDASGFVVARGDGVEHHLTAVTFVSSKWEHRAPEGHVLLRAFLGGVGREAVLARDDASLVTLARAEVAKLLGEERGDPVIARVFRHDRASPQPEIGHLARMRSLDERLQAIPGLYIAGNGYKGTGIPDCIKQARAIADRARASFM